MEDIYLYPKCFFYDKNYLDKYNCRCTCSVFLPFMVVNTPCLSFGKEYQPFLFELMELSKQGYF